MTKRKRCIALALVLSLVVVLIACSAPSLISTLVTTLGNASSSVAALEGDPTLADKIKTDTATASAQILAWKSGTSAQMALEALAIVQDDLNVIPYVGPYIPLIDIGLTAAEAIVAYLTSNSPPAPALKAHSPRHPHGTALNNGKPITDAAGFKHAWNCAANGNAATVSLAIK